MQQQKRMLKNKSKKLLKRNRGPLFVFSRYCMKEKIFCAKQFFYQFKRSNVCHNFFFPVFIINFRWEVYVGFKMNDNEKQYYKSNTTTHWPQNFLKFWSHRKAREDINLHDERKFVFKLLTNLRGALLHSISSINVTDAKTWPIKAK